MDVHCVDLHASQIQGFFNIPIDNFQAIPIISEYIMKKKLDNIVLMILLHRTSLEYQRCDKHHQGAVTCKMRCQKMRETD